MTPLIHKILKSGLLTRLNLTHHDSYFIHDFKRGFKDLKIFEVDKITSLIAQNGKSIPDVPMDEMRKRSHMPSPFVWVETKTYNPNMGWFRVGIFCVRFDNEKLIQYYSIIHHDKLSEPLIINNYSKDDDPTLIYSDPKLDAIVSENAMRLTGFAKTFIFMINAKNTLKTNIEKPNKSYIKMSKFRGLNPSAIVKTSYDLPSSVKIIRDGHISARKRKYHWVRSHLRKLKSGKVIEVIDHYRGDIAEGFILSRSCKI